MLTKRWMGLALMAAQAITMVLFSTSGAPTGARDNIADAGNTQPGYYRAPATFLAAAWTVPGGGRAAAGQGPSAPPSAQFHLTARPWSPLAVPKERYLDILEALCRYARTLQNPDGAIIDPYLHEEVQYSTPYYAYAVATLVGTGRAPDLLPSGIAAMEHATAQFGTGSRAIPQQHGEFFIASLTEALEKYQPLVNPHQYALWRNRMRLPLMKLVTNRIFNNWQTYAMKGEWLRSRAGLIESTAATHYIEQAWRDQQQSRIAAVPFGLYHDRSSDPDSLSVEAVGRGNLLALVEDGYDGPSASAIRNAVESGTRIALFLQDPSGQAPANGRTDDHVFVDVAYQLAFEAMAELRKVATREAMPALATTTSRPPKRSTVVATARCKAPRSVTSAARPSARESCNSAAAPPVASSSRSTRVTLAPRAISARAVSNPMPRAPPLTIATLPANS